MSSLEFNLKSCSSSSLVEKILEHGQRLRNSMVQAVLNNDPFNKEILHNSSQHVNTQNKRTNMCNIEKAPSSDYDQVHKYLHGDEMGLNEEMQALETLRSMSPNNLLRSTSEFKHQCHRKSYCDICNEYENRVFSENIPSNLHNSQKQKLHTSNPNRTNYILYKTAPNILKYVDSLNIHVYSLKFTNAGNTKITACATLNKPYLSCTNNTYFVEYTLPDILIKKQPQSRAKVNSGMKPDQTIRFCSKKVQRDSVYFKQQLVHLISNIEMIDLNSVHLEFRVSYRAVKQRTAILIGTATVHFGSLLTNQFFTTEQEISLLSASAPVVLGYIKVALQFGCDKIYFGKEFIDAINCSKENANLSDNDSIHKNEVKSTYFNSTKPNDHNTLQQHTDRNTINKSASINNDKIHLLYTLIHISEVRLLSNPIDTYIICRGFTRDDTFISKTIYNNINPVFNLYQLIPNLCSEEFINRLRDNYIIIEVWEKKEVDLLIGISKLSLHQLYIAYRNPAIVQYLTKNQYPTIAVDWWEPISNPNSNIDHGQLKALVALGTQSQIEILELNRNLKLERSNTIALVPEVTNVDRAPKLTVSVTDKNFFEENEHLNNIKEQAVPSRKVILMSDKYVQEPELEIAPTRTEKINENGKVDVSTQSEIIFEMNSETKDSIPVTADEPISQTDFLNSFFEHLLSARDLNQRAKNVDNTSTRIVEARLVTAAPDLDIKSSTPETTKSTKNTKNTQASAVENTKCINVPSIRNTSDLLDNLQKALGEVDTKRNEEIKTNQNIDNTRRFKAHIVIEGALHLPSRKKCKSKRNKMKSSKCNEDILPSTYVTFKGSEGHFMTSVVPKTTSPNWNFHCDSYISSDLLLNNQKRLILKVWRKSNGPSLQPNHDIDIVLGFAAIDLTVLLSGMPNVQGWFNIVDFTSKCNGQIKISVTPLETLTRCFNTSVEKLMCNSVEPLFHPPDVSVTETNADAPSELFSRALKRKFTELDEITQRLRQRLSAVTNDDSDVSNDFDDFDFERDLNTECMETEMEMEMLTFDNIEKLSNDDKLSSTEHEIETTRLSKEIATRSNSNLSEISTNVTQVVPAKKSGGLDSHLMEEKIKIDSLLEKLTLLSGDAENQYKHSFTQRYVSGCSINEHPEISSNSQEDVKSPDSLDTDLIFNPLLFQHMFTASLDSTPRLSAQDSTSSVQCTTLKSLVHDSFGGSSSISNDSPSTSSVYLSRQAPDGAGNNSQNNINI